MASHLLPASCAGAVKSRSIVFLLQFMSLMSCFFGLILFTSPTGNSFLKNEGYDIDFRDKYFQPILETFKNTQNFRLKTSFRGNTSRPKVFLVSTSPLHHKIWMESFEHIGKGLCPLPCDVTDDPTQYRTSDAVLVSLGDFSNRSSIEEFLSPRDTTQPWIIFSPESPIRGNFHGLNYSSLNGMFNRTMFYRRDADIYFVHGFVVPNADSGYLPSDWTRPSPKMIKKPFHERKKIVAFVSNCDDIGGRMSYIKALSKFVHIDVYGRCGTMKCGFSRFMLFGYRVDADECLVEVARKYLFYLSFENNICEDYVTEKVYNIQLYPIVPIVFGGANYSDILYPNSYIDALHHTPRQLAKVIKNMDEEKYNNMLKWRNHYTISTISSNRIYCQLCTKLYDPEFYDFKVYENFYDWFVKKSKCRKFQAISSNLLTIL